MLKSMRENVKSLKWVLWLVVAAFVVSIFFIWGASGKLTGDDAGNTLAVIGRKKISGDDYLQALRNRIEAIKSQYQEIDRAFIEQLNLPQQVLEQLVEQTLLVEQARAMRLRASDEELRDRITSIPGLQQNGKFVGYEMYKRVLQYNHINLSEFEHSLRQDIVLDKMIRLLTAGLAVTPDEVWSDYQKASDSAGIDLLILETSKVSLDEAPSAAEVQAFFEARKGAYLIQEKREGLAVFLKAEDLKKEIELSEKDIENYYQANLSRFTNPESVRVGRIWLPFEGKDKALVEAEGRRVLERLGAGGDFAALARELSKDAKASGGGDYGFYDWQSLPQPERDEIHRLTSGQTSDLIAEADGLAVIRVTEKTAATTTPLAGASAQIRSILLDEKARQLADTRIAKIEKEAKSARSLETALRKAGLKGESTGLLKNGEAWSDNDPSGAVGTALFGLKEKEVSAPVYTYTGVGLVELRKVEAPRPAAFEEVKADVETALVNERKMETSRARLAALGRRLEEKNWEDIAARNGFEFKTVEAHKRDQYIAIVGESKTADDLAFTLPLNEASAPFDFETGTAVLRVRDRKTVTREEFENVKETQTAQILNQKKNMFLQAYLAKLKQEKGIQIKYDKFLQLTQDVLSRYESAKQ